MIPAVAGIGNGTADTAVSGSGECLEVLLQAVESAGGILPAETDPERIVQRSIQASRKEQDTRFPDEIVVIERGVRGEEGDLVAAHLTLGAQRHIGLGHLTHEHGRARWREVSLGLRGLENLEVTQGLSVGVQIVRPVEGQKPPLTDGQRIAAK